MAQTAEKSIEQKLEALLKLQQIDSELDSIKRLRGDLPNEVQDLEDEIAGYQTRIQRFEEQIKEWEQVISEMKNRKKEAEKLIDKYKGQQMNVKNNREYEALAKEIESEELEIILCDKKTKEAKEKIDSKKAEIENVKRTLEERKKFLDEKQKELTQLIEESEEEEKTLLAQREKQKNQIDERLLASYEKIRKNSSNGLAVVLVKRDACGGCYSMVPPQRQVDIREKKKIIVCEHCGRILAGVEETQTATEEKTTRKRGLKKISEEV
ncbi:MAG: C4-type zinc ribbon domain-containing protein [Raineya sp.]|nr:C4-type zinc ribbon domain-containing protein [Raineya sp.]MDW8295772.1 C4-type zinc ribbon domain-containing protein [Raineya sp.]